MNTEDQTDTETTPVAQNRKLREHLDGIWIDYKIIKVERIERAYPKEKITGWRVTYE